MTPERFGFQVVSHICPIVICSIVSSGQTGFGRHAKILPNLFTGRESKMTEKEVVAGWGCVGSTFGSLGGGRIYLGWPQPAFIPQTLPITLLITPSLLQFTNCCLFMQVPQWPLHAFWWWRGPPPPFITKIKTGRIQPIVSSWSIIQWKIPKKRQWRSASHCAGSSPSHD